MSINTDNLDDEGIVTDRMVETYYRPLEEIAEGDGYLRVVVDDGGTDIETRIPYGALESLGWTRPAE